VRFFNCRKPSLSLAGREGFEPSNARSKAWCLTSLATAQRIWIQRLRAAPYQHRQNSSRRNTTRALSRRNKQSNLFGPNCRATAPYNQTVARNLRRAEPARTFDFSSLRAGIEMLLMRFFAVNPPPVRACTATANLWISGYFVVGLAVEG
jgi:hypothetical protein